MRKSHCRALQMAHVLFPLAGDKPLSDALCFVVLAGSSTTLTVIHPAWTIRGLVAHLIFS
jgi:hypothetical protein